MQKLLLPAALALALALPAAAQEGSAAMCAGFPEGFTGRCHAAVQLGAAAQPQLGLLAAGGTFGPGGAAPAGGTPARASLRATAVRLSLPAISRRENPEVDRMRVLGLAVTGEGSYALTPAISVTASASALPLELSAGETFAPSMQVAFGAGARGVLLRESGRAPGVALSGWYRRIGRTRIGLLCEGPLRPGTGTSPRTSTCNEIVHVAQATVGVEHLSARAVVSRRAMGVELGAGAGFDHFAGTVEAAVVGERGTVASPTRIYHSPGTRLSTGRWTAFLNGSLPMTGGAAVAELGWMQGGEPVEGFGAGSDFDPRAGIPFASIGGRFAF